MIGKRLDEDLKDALRSGDKFRLGVIRMLRAELKNAQIAAGRALEHSEQEKIVRSYVKKRKEAAESYRRGGREDLAEKEIKESEIARSYLPPELEEEELRALAKRHIEEAGAMGPKDFGRVMKGLMAEVGSRAEGAVVAKVLKELLARTGGGEG